MKADIHPEFRPVVFVDSSTGTKFLAGSSAATNETTEFEGQEYPSMRMEITSDSHPFYTGKQKFAQADGAVDKFNKRYGMSN